MPVNQTTLPPPPPAHLGDEALRYWRLKLQSQAPMREIDTTAGNVAEAPPAAGVNTTTGQTNQNQEITYVKISADANTFTLSGANLPLGPYTLTTQGQVLKIKSNGTLWRKSA